MTLNRRRRIPCTLTALTLAALAASGGCASDKSTIANAQQANDQLAPAVMNDADLQGYVQSIGDRVIAAAKSYDAAGQGPDTHTAKGSSENQWMFSNAMKFHLVNSKTVNAFTTGGQHMYVYTALLQLCDNEDDLAAVMAHEFAHVYSRHVQKGTNRATGQTVFAYGAMGAGYLAGGKENGSSYAQSAQQGAAAVGSFVGMSFTRGDEAQADEWGFKFYSKAGWDPDKFGAFFQKMIDAGYDKTPAYASDHPTLASRVAAAKVNAAAWDKVHPNGAGRTAPIADAARFAQYKARAAQDSATMPDDSQTQKAQQLLANFNSCFAPADKPPTAK